MRKTAGFASKMSPSGRAVLFALKSRLGKKARRTSGWAAIVLLVAPWLLSGLFGLTLGVLHAPALLVWGATELLFWRKETPPGMLTLFLPVAPFVYAAGFAAAARFLWGAPSTSFKRRRARFEWVASAKAQNALKSAWPVVEREELWSAERARQWGIGFAVGLMESVFAFAVGFWGVAAALVAIACAPLAILIVAFLWMKKKAAGLKLARNRIASAIEALREEGAQEFARAEQEQLAGIAAQSVRAGGATEKSKSKSRWL